MFDELIARLQGRYPIGPRNAEGEPEFGFRQFQTAPICHEAATALIAAQAEIERLREALTAMVEHDVFYMTVNQLGDPERQLRIVRARAALAPKE